MRYVAWVAIAAAVAVALYFTALPGELPVGRDAASGLSGVYSINGVDDTGAEYSGTMTVADADGSGYPVEWVITGAIQRGSGEVVGSTFVTHWTVVASADAEPISGSTVYELGPDGAPVTGRRVLDRDDGAGTAVEQVFVEQ